MSQVPTGTRVHSQSAPAVLQEGNQPLRDRNTKLEELERGARRARRRLRLLRGIDVACKVAPFPLLASAIALTAVKLGHPASVTPWLVGVGLVAGAALVFWVLGVRQGPAPEAGAIELDRYHELHGRIANALAFARLPPSERTPFMEAAIKDAERLSPALSPKKAVPLGLPPSFPALVGLGSGLLLLALLEVRTLREVPPAKVDATVPLVLARDDVEYFREAGDELMREAESQEVREAIQRFNQLILDIANQNVSRDEVFRRLVALEKDLAALSESDRAALEQALEDRGSALKSSPRSRPLGEALANHDFKKAQAELEKLAGEVREDKDATKAVQEKERLRKALEAASKQTQERLQRIESRRQELLSQQRRLLNKKKEGAKLTAKEQQQVKELERQLERLDREKREATAGGKQMSELDRRLAEAAQKLMQDAGRSAGELERGAQSMNRQAERQLSEGEKKELLRRLEELRELLRQQGQAGKDQLRRLERFGQKARGQRSPDGQPEEQQVGTKPGGTALGLRPGSAERLPGQGSEGPQGSGQDPASAEGKERGPGYGSGSDPNLRGEESELEGQFKDVALVAPDTGEGTASEEVIAAAAQRGFRGGAYRDIFVEYENVAESVIHQDEVPPGYRFYVRRYFQLIRPRD